jgi:hypothetical protein
MNSNTTICAERRISGGFLHGMQGTQKMTQLFLAVHEEWNGSQAYPVGLPFENSVFWPFLGEA